MSRSRVIISTFNCFPSVAVTHLRNVGHYRTVNAIVSGVENKEAAHGSIKDYHDQMTSARWINGHESFSQSRLKVFKGGENPLKHPVPHEAHFPGTPRPIQHSFEDLHKHIHPDTKQIDVFHLAPMKDQDMNTLFHGIKKTGRKVGIFHTTVGYNNLQGPESKSTGNDEKRHLENLHKKPHNKDATTILMQTKTTFGDSKGGTQSLDWTKPRSPPNHMKGVTEDEPFHLEQFKHADGEIAKHNTEHKDIPQKQVRVPEPIPGKDEKEQQANIWAGRHKKTEHGREMSKILYKHAEQRQEALKKIESHNPKADHSNAIRRLDAVKDGMKNPCAVEVCDANHVATTIDAYYNHPSKLVPVTVKTGRDVAAAKKGDPVHGHTIIGETSDNARELLEPSFPPIFAKTKAENASKP